MRLEGGGSPSPAIRSLATALAPAESSPSARGCRVDPRLPLAGSLPHPESAAQPCPPVPASCPVAPAVSRALGAPAVLTVRPGGAAVAGTGPSSRVPE